MQNIPPSDTVESLLQEAEAQIQVGNLSEAAVIAQRALDLDPRNGAALNGAAQLALKLGNIKEAEHFARRAAQEQPLAAHVLTLAEALKTKGAYDEAAKYYLLILKKLPQEQKSLLGMAEIYELTGHRTLAIEHLERALSLTPHDLALFRRFSKLVPFTESPRVLEALENAKPTDDSHVGLRVQHASNLATWKEYAERAKREMPSHARTLSDLFFTYGGDSNPAYEALLDTLIARGAVKMVAAQKAMCLLARGERKESESYFRIRAEAEPDSLYSNINFSDEFYLSLETKIDDELFGSLPDLIEVLAADFEDAPIIFLSCDFNYYQKFARTLLLSLDHVSEVSQVHLHIMDASPDGRMQAKEFATKLKKTKIAISSEEFGMTSRGTDAARSYYHAIRFIRMYQHLKRYNKPMWQMDVDGLMNRDPCPVFKEMRDSDITLWGLPGRWEPWSQFNASLMGISPTPKGIAYLRLTAAYIMHYHDREELHWGIDQLAMFSVHEFLKDQGRGPAVNMLHSDVVDGECKDHTFIWSNGGIGKFMPLKLASNITNMPPDSPRVRYFQALKKYSDLT